MKKQFLISLFACFITATLMPVFAQDVVEEEQTTEGKEFWVTFLQADQGGSEFSLDLAISSRYDCKVTISNPFTNYSEVVDVVPGVTRNVNLDVNSGGADVSAARARQTANGKICYAFNSEAIDTCALHIESDYPISLFASNYQYASFDATNVLPVVSLQDDYMIQTYSPSDNDGDGASQGSHFAIIAAEDNTVIDYCPTVPTEIIKAAKSKYEFSGGTGMTEEELKLANFKPGDTLTSPVLKKGQVYYVWTGKGVVKEAGDFSGTRVKARDGKKIAVFQGCPHTNIPYKVKLRDHIFSQAMPVKTWGNTFVLTASNGRKRDIYRVMALNDQTTIYFGDSAVKTINANEYWEFELGEAYGSLPKPAASGSSCFLKTSCPCAVHQFMVSQQYDGDKNNNGDPAMLWINPIEQQINQITFSTYSSKKGTTAHNINIVTDNPSSIKLNGVSIASEFNKVNGSDTYYFARHSLGSETTSHTLKSDSGNFIAHVYGFTKNESYAYNAGGYVKSLTQYITINGQVFSPDKENNLCGKDTVKFACKPDYEFDSIVWHFGDETPDVIVKDTSTVVPHYYSGTQDYNATCSIYRNSSNVCVGQSAVDVIKIKVTIGRYSFTIGEANIPCPDKNGVQGPGIIPYTSTINLEGSNVTVDFDEKAKAAGFTKSNLTIKPDYFELTLPDNDKVERGVTYGIKIEIKSDCGDTTAILPFQIPVGSDVIDQRYTNVLGLIKDHPLLAGKDLSGFQWFRIDAAGDTSKVIGQITSNLNMYDLSTDDYKTSEYFVCYYINKDKSDQVYTCSCSRVFNIDDTHQHVFDITPDSLVITANYEYKENKIFVNANWGGKTDIECYAQWINTSGNVYQDLKFNLPDGGCTIPVPAEKGLYLLRVTTDGKSRSFKFIINH